MTGRPTPRRSTSSAQARIAVSTSPEANRRGADAADLMEVEPTGPDGKDVPMPPGPGQWTPGPICGSRVILTVHGRPPRSTVQKMLSTIGVVAIAAGFSLGFGRSSASRTVSTNATGTPFRSSSQRCSSSQGVRPFSSLVSGGTSGASWAMVDRQVPFLTDQAATVSRAPEEMLTPAAAGPGRHR